MNAYRIVTACAIALAAVFAASAARAELKSNPDENTLWIEDGVDFKTGEGSSGKYWSGMPAKAAEGGGFTLSPEEKKYALGRYLPYSPDYPWLVFEIAKVVPHKPAKPGGHVYRAMNLMVPANTSPFAMVSHIRPGLVTVNLGSAVPGKPGDKPKTAWSRIYMYGADVTFKYIKTVKLPANRIEMTSAAVADGKIKTGDAVNLKVVLDKPASGVTVTFYHSYTMPQMTVLGKKQLELKPEGEAPATVFAGTFVFDEVKNHRLKPNQTGFNPGSFLVKAEAADGGPGLPMWTANPFGMQLREQE